MCSKAGRVLVRKIRGASNRPDGSSWERKTDERSSAIRFTLCPSGHRSDYIRPSVTIIAHRSTLGFSAHSRSLLSASQQYQLAINSPRGPGWPLRQTRGQRATYQTNTTSAIWHHSCSSFDLRPGGFSDPLAICLVFCCTNVITNWNWMAVASKLRNLLNRHNTRTCAVLKRSQFSPLHVYYAGKHRQPRSACDD